MWLPTEALRTKRTRTRLDRDPITGAEITWQRGDDHSIILTERGAAFETVLVITGLILGILCCTLGAYQRELHMANEKLTPKGFPSNGNTRTLSNVVEWQRPHTRLGKWSLRLATLFVVMFAINSVVFMPLLGQSTANPWWQQTLLPFYGIFMLLCGLAAGVSGLLAVIRQHERSWLVWLTLVPAVFVLFLLLGEFLVPH